VILVLDSTTTTLLISHGQVGERDPKEIELFPQICHYLPTSPRS